MKKTTTLFVSFRNSFLMGFRGIRIKSKEGGVKKMTTRTTM